MKPCDVRSMVDVNNLNEQGLRFNNYSIKGSSNMVLLYATPYFRIEIPARHFKSFAEWYLEDQTDD